MSYQILGKSPQLSSPIGMEATPVSQSERTAARGARPEKQSSPVVRTQSSEESWVGKTLGKYAVDKWLGGGGMGQVYLARHTWLDLPVAIKVMNPLFQNDVEAIDRFRREARLAASLNHPNIVRCTDGGAIKNSLYLVTEYLEGVDLKEFVETNGPVAPEAAAWIIMEAAKALDYAHSKGMIHRDIKPSNLMLLKDGNIMLLDFGLARYVNSQTNLTSSGQFMGTVDYVAPEQAVDTRNVDHRADIYSLGCTLYFLLAGQAPFAGDAYDSVVSKILAHTEEEPQPITRFSPQTSKHLQQTMQKMMAKSPSDRFSSAVEVVKALEKVSKPIKVDHRDARKAVRKSASVGTGASSFFASALFIVGRTILSIIGLIEKVEINSNSRIGGKNQFRWRFSPKGVITLGLILFMIYMIFLSGMIHIEHAPI